MPLRLLQMFRSGRVERYPLQVERRAAELLGACGGYHTLAKHAAGNQATVEAIEISIDLDRSLP